MSYTQLPLLSILGPEPGSLWQNTPGTLDMPQREGSDTSTPTTPA